MIVNICKARFIFLNLIIQITILQPLENDLLQNMAIFLKLIWKNKKQINARIILYESTKISENTMCH